ncbi:MAG: hypothetical protein COB33_008500 [Thiotrichaceae bacterium]|nr:hypothetical protein [Thiotrichaceae bacterium]PCI14715.1 MAG: hypothetical protein COB71_01175 [Thiotrichales bacterium]
MKLNKIIAAIGVATALTLPGISSAALDTDSATVSMSVGLYASLTGLDNFVLSPSSTNGAAGSIYSGSDTFNLESNGQVRVSLSGGDLSNGSDSVTTTYEMDDDGVTFDTTASSIHNANHSVSASAELGDISSQKAGSYSSTITITVSAI